MAIVIDIRANKATSYVTGAEENQYTLVLSEAQYKDLLYKMRQEAPDLYQASVAELVMAEYTPPAEAESSDEEKPAGRSMSQRKS